MDVVPHDEFAERKDAQKSVLFHVPSGLGHNASAYQVKYFCYIYAAFVAGQLGQAADAYVEILLEHLKQGNVHQGFFFSASYYIAFLCRSSDNFNGQQQKWGVTGLFAFWAFVPF